MVVFEIMQMFKIKAGDIPENEIYEIDGLYRRWEREILWKANNLEDKRHERVCRPAAPTPWCKCRTRQEEIHEWEDWIIENYDLPDEQRHWTIPLQVLARVSPPQPERPAKDLEKQAAG